MAEQNQAGATAGSQSTRESGYVPAHKTIEILKHGIEPTWREFLTRHCGIRLLHDRGMDLEWLRAVHRSVLHRSVNTTSGDRRPLVRSWSRTRASFRFALPASYPREHAVLAHSGSALTGTAAAGPLTVNRGEFSRASQTRPWHCPPDPPRPHRHGNRHTKHKSDDAD